jgi:DNA-binding NarL/FixJ family response regulator
LPAKICEEAGYHKIVMVSAGRPTILVVEDEKPLLEEILLMLSINNFDTLGASTAAEGIALAFAKRPSLILSDINLPDQDGFAVLDAVQQNPLTLSTPFIFLSARVTRSDLRRGMERGADDYVPKPFTAEELITAIERQLSKRATVKVVELRAISHQLLETEEKEQRRTAHLLREIVGQNLHSARMLIDSSKRMLDSSNRARFQEIEVLINQATLELHELSMDMDPTMLQQLGLLSSLVWYVERHNQQTKQPVTLNADGFEDGDLSPELRHLIFRIIQQLLVQVKASLEVQSLSLVLQRDQTQIFVLVSGNIPAEKMVVSPATLQSVLETNNELVRLYEYTLAFGGELSVKIINDATLDLQISVPLERVSAKTPTSTRDFTSATTDQRRAPVTHAQTKRVGLICQDLPMRRDLTMYLQRSPDMQIVSEHATFTEFATNPPTDHPDVLIVELTDVSAPDMDASLADSTLPTLFIGDETQDHLINRLLGRDATSGFLLKTSIEGELAHAVRRLYAGQRFLGTPFLDQAIEYFLQVSGSLEKLQGYETLTKREKEILWWVAAGYTSAEIADRLTLSPRTVDTHRSNIMGKLNLRSKTELLRLTQGIKLFD